LPLENSTIGSRSETCNFKPALVMPIADTSAIVLQQGAAVADNAER
jgi:hypothetical protein